MVRYAMHDIMNFVAHPCYMVEVEKLCIIKILFLVHIWNKVVWRIASRKLVVLTLFIVELAVSNHVLVRNMQKLMINETVNTASKLQTALIIAEAGLSTLPKDTPYQDFEQRWSSGESEP